MHRHEPLPLDDHLPVARFPVLPPRGFGGGIASLGRVDVNGDDVYGVVLDYHRRGRRRRRRQVHHWRRRRWLTNHRRRSGRGKRLQDDRGRGRGKGRGGRRDNGGDFAPDLMDAGPRRVEVETLLVAVFALVGNHCNLFVWFLDYGEKKNKLVAMTKMKFGQ